MSLSIFRSLVGRESSLAEGQPVKMQVVDTPKGREALSISLDRTRAVPRNQHIVKGGRARSLAPSPS
jgi:hypothetical protein